MRSTMTAAEAREILGRVKQPLKGPSRVNPSFTRQQAYDIFTGILVGKPDDYRLPLPSAKNIRREFGEGASQ